MATKHLAYYLKAFTSLRRDYKFGGAPHKPILLLSILALMDEGVIEENKIYITPELISQFKTYWNLLVTSPHTPNFSLPFYHLVNEKGGYWKLKMRPGASLVLTTSNSIKSFRSLADSVDYAFFDDNLFIILTERNNRDLLRHAMLQKYFPESVDRMAKPLKNYIIDLEAQFLAEPPMVYLRRLEEVSNETAREEEAFLRGAVFKREVPKLYNNSCAVTGLRVDSVRNVSMVDACHIVQFAESGDDSVQNGIALCPNMHRAFDRGLIAIDSNYKVMISPSFTESASSHSLTQFEGKEILLPRSVQHYPSQEKLEIHRRRFNFQ